MSYSPAGLLVDIDEAGAAPNTSSLGAFIWPQTVIDEKNRLQGYIEPLRFVVQDCAGLTKEDKAAWADFYTSWRKFFCRNDTGDCADPDYSIWGLGSQMDQCEAFGRQADSWYDKLSAAKCALTEPKDTPPPAAPDWSSAVRWGAIGAIVLAGVYVTSKTGIPVLFPKGRKR